MILLVGLGNPGKKYEKNRHNVGFLVADEILRDKGLADYREKFNARFSKGDALSILKPETFMNLSGDSVQPAQAFLKIAPNEIVVVHDELDLAFGDVRLKVGGGHAGHNGLRSIIGRLGTPEFVRVRVGIGRPPAGFRGDVADYVLQDFDASERAELTDIITKAKSAAYRVLEEGVAAAMNSVNQKAPVRNSGGGQRV